VDIQNSYRKIIENYEEYIRRNSSQNKRKNCKRKVLYFCFGAGEPDSGSKSKMQGRKITFLQALQKDGMSYICEVKKASPSKGLIAPDFPYLAIAKEYEQAGASAISCLTEPFYFQGADQYLREISAAVQIPVLRKDFTVDEYMIYQAKFPLVLSRSVTYLCYPG